MSAPTPALPVRTGALGPSLLVAAPILVVALWYWLGLPAAVPTSPLAPGEKIACLSYSPFEGAQSPFDPTIPVSVEQIDRQFAALSGVTDCIRTYAVNQGLDAAPALARKHGLKLLLGLWLSRERDRNAAEIDRAIALGKEYPDVIRAIVVGNEVLLRGELPVGDIAAALKKVRAETGLPVTYADVWEFWEKNQALKDEVDFVTVHILPYWEDDPVGVIGARDHVAEVRRHIGELFAGKDVLIGETGWPSAGRMREDALPSPANQVRYLSEIIAMAKANGWDYNLIEAKDQPWKRELEGTVGGHWGILDDGLGLKFHWGEPISSAPAWAFQAAGGLAVALVLIAAGRGATSRAPARLAALAFVAGMALPWWAFEIPLVSLDLWDWIFAAVTLALAAASAVAGARMLATGAERPTIATLLGGEPGRAAAPAARAAGWALLVVAVVLAATLVALVADSRYRDFQTAAFAVPALVALMLPIAAGTRRVERLLGLAIAALAVATVVHEGPQNLQAIGFGLVALAFAAGLRPWRAGRG